MKRSEINNAAAEARAFFTDHQFHLPVWVDWTLEQWTNAGPECDEIRNNCLGWDVTDFGKGDFAKEGLTLITIRNGNAKLDKKVYCEKIMFVKEMQVTPVHFHWRKMEDIINRGGGELCMRLWKADENEGMTQDDVEMQIDGITTVIKAGEVLRLKPGQSISFTPYVYHTFWAENGDCMVGEVSTVNDDANDNRFYEETGRFPEIIEDEPIRYVLCTEYPEYLK